MELSSPIIIALLATGAMSAVLLHSAFDWGYCKCPFSTRDTPDPAEKRSQPIVSSDNQILKEKINNVLRSHNEGKSETVLPPFDPLLLESMIVKEGPNMLPVDVKLSNVTIKGLSKLRVTDVHRNKLKKLEITYFIDKLEIEGNYDLNASFMIMPISLSGPCSFIYENMTVTLAADLKEVIEEGNNFYQVENMVVTNNPEKFTMNVKNLVSGEEAFDSIMNKFLNKHFKPLIIEAMSQAHEALYLGIANMILSQMPINTSDPNRNSDNITNNPANKNESNL
ncbi:unnamed protein product [Nezara viridula]|uniref:Uncharacterized protein n=1 Tax=Nezara viridula TaxID=85310 RepID=A0A9P0GYX5_NEZVI|nr:unnamed protein product [Nezara viridula]